jgi:integrase
VATEMRRGKRKAANGRGSVRPCTRTTKGKVWSGWRGRVMVGHLENGKPDVRTVYASTEKECWEKLDQIIAKVRGGTLATADKERATVAAYLDRWVEATRTSVRPKTHKRYAELVRKHLKPGLGRHQLGKLKPDHVQAFYAAKLAATDPKTKRLYSPRTVHHLHRVLHRALEMAIKWGYIPRNVCDAVDPPKVPKKEIIPPTPEEVGRLLDAAEAAGDRYVGLWALAALTGARQGELLGLQWGDIDLDTGTLHIARSLEGAKGGKPEYGEPKTPKSRRLVDLDSDAVATLRAHRDRQGWEKQKLGDAWAPYNLVFTSRLGTPLDQKTVTYAFKRALKRVGLSKRVRFQDLRHGAISMMLKEGVPVTSVSETVGHHSPAMTLGVYGHLIPGAKREAAEKLAAAIRRTRQGAV